MPRRRTIAAASLVLLVLAAAPAGRTWNFDAEPDGGLPAGFVVMAGEWKVEADGGGRVLAQIGASSDETFNLVLIDGVEAKDVDLSVRMRAVSGELDQGGGLVWRARDAKNYYVARHNPLEDNDRVYKVVDGVRTQLGSADIPRSPGWHTLRVTMRGDHIVCSYDGKPALDVTDATFPDAGRIGLWTKADARSRFDDLRLDAR